MALELGYAPVVKMQESKVNKRVFLWDLTQTKNGFCRVRITFNDLSMQHLSNMNNQFDIYNVLNDMDFVLW